MNLNIDFVHLADVHIGLKMSGIVPIRAGDGLYLKEHDINKAFKRMVDKVISLQPKALVIAGDLFDSYSVGSNHISFVIEELRRVMDRGIYVVVISGNHDVPGSALKYSAYELLDVALGENPLYHSAYREMKWVKVGKDLEFCLIPHTALYNQDYKLDDLKKHIENPNKKHILVIHGEAEDAGQYPSDEINTIPIPKELLALNWNYCALGHIHKMFSLPSFPNAYYSGSIENTVSSGTGVEGRRGGLMVSFDGSGKAQITELTFPVRPIKDITVDLTGEDLSEISYSEVYEYIEGLCRKARTKDAIVNPTVKGITREFWRGFSQTIFKDSIDDAVFIRPPHIFFRDDLAQRTNNAGVNDETDEAHSLASLGDISSIPKETKKILKRLLSEEKITETEAKDIEKIVTDLFRAQQS